MAADHHPVADMHFAGERYAVGDHAVVADDAVVAHVRIALLFGGFALTAAFGVYSAYWYRKNRELGSPRQRSAMEIPWDRDWFLLARGLAIAVLLELAALAYRTGRLTYRKAFSAD